jgi:hypothetical protein
MGKALYTNEFSKSPLTLYLPFGKRDSLFVKKILYSEV